MSVSQIINLGDGDTGILVCCYLANVSGVFKVPLIGFLYVNSIISLSALKRTERLIYMWW